MSELGERLLTTYPASQRLVELLNEMTSVERMGALGIALERALHMEDDPAGAEEFFKAARAYMRTAIERMEQVEKGN